MEGLARLVDHAPMFPPASLDLEAAKLRCGGATVPTEEALGIL